MKKINLENQERTPYLEAYKEYLDAKTTVFDVPGHHQGKIHTDFDKIFGKEIYKKDINAPRGMDNLAHPHFAIKDAQDLFAKACNADYCKFLVNGSTSGNLIMIMSCLKANEKIILPRNIHKSVISAIVLSGAIPVFVMPEIDKQIEIVNQISYSDWKKAIDKNKDAKAIFIINPTYFGATCDLKKIVEYAHKNNMKVLVDEAHGSHFYFSKHSPITAMDAGADMATLSIHKTGGSLTQSSVLLGKGERVSRYDVNKTCNLITTTSPSSLLIASLDSARKFMVFHGNKHIYNAIKLAHETLIEINKIKGFIAHGKDYFKEKGSYSYDETKLVVELDKLEITGFDLYKILKDDYHIQIELAETYVFLLLFTVGSKKEDVLKLIDALKDISKRFYNPKIVYEDHHYLNGFPTLKIRPRAAYHAPLEVIKLDDAKGRISKETIMIYPPGIPIIIPGEVFSQEIINELNYYIKTNANIVSDWDGNGEVSVIDEKNATSLKILEDSTY